MAEMISMEKLYNELLALRNEIHYIKTHMVDVDTTLTADEELELDESLKELEEGKTFSLEDIERDRENA
jgi:DNA-binding LytR/AlgR family response regulator